MSGIRIDTQLCNNLIQEEMTDVLSNIISEFVSKSLFLLSRCCLFGGVERTSPEYKIRGNNIFLHVQIFIMDSICHLLE